MTEILNEKDFLATTDLCLASAASCYGYTIEAVDKTTPNKATFLIRRDSQLDELVRQYFAHQLKVEPMVFFNAIKELKTRLYHV